MDSIKAPQIVEHLSTSLAFTPYDTKFSKPTTKQLHNITIKFMLLSHQLLIQN
jgi:hypothetical protein